jgi:hypothetical protein
MKYLIMILCLLFLGCADPSRYSSKESCDKLFSKIYPTQTYAVADIPGAEPWSYRVYFLYVTNQFHVCTVGASKTNLKILVTNNVEPKAEKPL